MSRTVRIRRRPRPLAPAVARLVSFLGCALSLQATPAAAQMRRPVPPSRAARLAAPPWSEATGTSSVPVARARVTHSAPLPIHPAVHPAKAERAAAPIRLFPRAADVLEERRRRADAIARHPAGKAPALPSTPGPADPVRVRRLQGAADASDASQDRGRTASHPAPQAKRRRAISGSTTSYRVVCGDTLWDIASRRSGRTGAAAVHALTQKIYDLNRDVIGSDPDLIIPGEILRLPVDLDR